jgi:hypothetical protein
VLRKETARLWNVNNQKAEGEKHKWNDVEIKTKENRIKLLKRSEENGDEEQKFKKQELPTSRNQWTILQFLHAVQTDWHFFLMTMLTESEAVSHRFQISERNNNKKTTRRLINTDVLVEVFLVKGILLCSKYNITMELCAG